MKRWVIITIIAILALCLLGFLGWRLAAGMAEKPVRTAQANRQNVVKDIAFTGKVTAKQSANLSFELSGITKELYVNVGDTVQTGQKLALLDPQSAQLELAKAHADAASTTSTEYLSWQKVSEDATHTISENAKSLEQMRQAVRDAKIALDQSKEVFAQRAQELGDDSATTLATQSTVVANTAAYNAAKGALATALTTTARTDAAAKNTADIAYSQYVSSQQAAPNDSALSSLQALERLAQVKTAKSIIRAPFNGVITKKNVEVGELASVGSSVMTIETLDTLEITSDVPETDALAMAQGMDTSITFDALPDTKEMRARVDSIYPAAIDIEGVPTFHITLLPDTALNALRSGLTANITVHVASRENVITIPRRAIIRKDNKEFVRIQRGEESPEVEITTGLSGSDGLVEVTSGLSEGDTIITP